uniref:ABM domain-containing protein n=1 Tax=Thermosporothrix sp. COM3 TaxID=2490863 RepID=A0A455SKL9_9CHLR|nr:hypothetical protein KTC_26120 [Thermosporothrix sp. COM3]
MSIVTVIEPIEAPEGQEALVREQWQKMSAALAHATGFLASRLYEVDDEVEARLISELNFQWLRARPAGRARFRFVHIAEWESLAHYNAATQRERGLSFPTYPAVYHLHSGASEPKLTTKSGQTFSLIALFEVPAGQEAILRQQWQTIVEGMGKVEGSLGPGLYEREPVEEVTSLLSSHPISGTDIRFVNVAEWESLAHYGAVIRSRRHVEPITFPNHSAYYHVVAENYAAKGEIKRWSESSKMRR